MLISYKAVNSVLIRLAVYFSTFKLKTEIFIQIATGSMNNKLLRYSAKDHFFRAALCRMCIDVQDASNSLNRYEEMFPIFADSRECKLLKVGALILMCMHSDKL